MKKLKITGMHCKSCSSLILDILEDNNLEGSFDEDKLTINSESESSIRKAINEIKEEGYGVEE